MTIEQRIVNFFSLIWNWCLPLRDWLGRVYWARWKLWAAVAVGLAVLLVGLVIFAPRFAVSLDPAKIVAVPNGSATGLPVYAVVIERQVSFPWEIRRDNPSRREESSVVLTMNGVELKHNPYYYYVLSQVEPGHFAHSKYKSVQNQFGWNSNSGVIQFTTPDGSDPLTAAYALDYSVQSQVNFYLYSLIVFLIIVGVLPLGFKYSLLYLDFAMTEVKTKTILILLAIFCTSLILVSIGLSYKIRPYYDDIVFANQIHDYGFWGMQKYYWLKWAGAFSGVLINSLLVAIPQAVLPWSLSGAVCFVLTLLLIGFTITYGVKQFFRLGAVEYWAVFAFSLLGWWFFLWSRDFILFPDSFNGMQAYGMITWQNVNASYIVPPLLMILLGTYCTVNSDQPSWRTIACAILLGLLAGSNTYALSFMIIAILLLSFVAIRFFKLQLPKSKQRILSIFAITTLLSFVIMMVAPGNYARLDIFTTSKIGLVYSAPKFSDYLVFVIQYPLEFFYSNIFSVGSLIAFGGAIAVGILLGERINLARRRFLLYIPLATFGFLLVYVLLVRFTEIFAYPAYWHYLTGTMVIYVVEILLGFWAGSHLFEQLATIPLRAYAAMLLIVFVVTGAKVSAETSKLFESQRSQWSSGFRNTVHYPLTLLTNYRFEHEVAQDYWAEFVTKFPHKSVRY